MTSPSLDKLRPLTSFCGRVRLLTGMIFILGSLTLAIRFARSSQRDHRPLKSPKLRVAPSWGKHIPGLRPKVWRAAYQAYRCAKQRKLGRREILTIIDFSYPSHRKRLWVLDLRQKRVLFHEHTTHGRHTGMTHARSFSNRPQSKQSSLGLFLTLGTYNGKHGYSLRLRGLEAGINHLAKRRAIVVHGARYVTTRFIKRNGRAGRSWGCPAVRPEIARRFIDHIKGRTLLFAYVDQPHRSAYRRRWWSRSRYLHCR